MVLGVEFTIDAFETAAGFYAALRSHGDAGTDGAATNARPRNLVFYTHALTHGGAERVMAMIASDFAEHGDQVTFIVDRVMPDHGLSLSPHLRLEILAGTHGSQLRALTALIKTIRPDLMISALSASNVKLAAAALAARMTSRHVMTWHGYPQAETGVLSRIGYVLAPFISRMTAQQICVSDGLLAHMRRRGLGSGNSTRIYNPVDMGGLHVERKVKSPGEPRIVLSAGRLAPVKNFPLLLQSFVQLQDQNSRLVILGDGPERANLLHEAQRLGIADRVDMPGHIHDMRDWYSRADVFVVPSNSESFSNVLVEALSYGLPVVATDCGGPREILADGHYGALVPRGDPSAMTQAIHDALADDGKAAMLRRQRAQHFDLVTAMRQYDDLFCRLTGLAGENALAARRSI